jgi:hypothetical protein
MKTIVKHIGEQFYYDHSIKENGVKKSLENYSIFEAILIGESGTVKFRYPKTEGYEEIIKVDDGSIRYFITSENTIELGGGNVRHEERATVAFDGAPDNVLKPIFVGVMFKLVDTQIGRQ